MDVARWCQGWVGGRGLPFAGKNRSEGEAGRQKPEFETTSRDRTPPPISPESNPPAQRMYITTGYIECKSVYQGLSTPAAPSAPAASLSCCLCLSRSYLGMVYLQMGWAKKLLAHCAEWLAHREKTSNAVRTPINGCISVSGPRRRLVRPSSHLLLGPLVLLADLLLLFRGEAADVSGSHQGRVILSYRPGPLIREAAVRRRSGRRPGIQ